MLMKMRGKPWPLPKKEEAVFDPNGSMPSQLASPPTPNLWDRLSQTITKLSLHFKARLEDGIEEFHYILELAKLAEQVQKRQRPSLSPRRLAGFLIEERGASPIPLWEGNNPFQLSEKGVLTPSPVTTEGTYDFEIRVAPKQTLFERRHPLKDTRVVDTNDMVFMGTKQFLIKMLPEEYRREMKAPVSISEGQMATLRQVEAKHAY